MISIAESTKTEAASDDGAGRTSFDFAALNGDKIFLLDAKEATRLSYGYRVLYGVKKRGVKWQFWWMRSPDKSKVGMITDGGSIGQANPNNENICVSPAFNVNLSSVIFSSVISGTVGSIGAEYKLTLKDGNLKIEQDGDIIRECSNKNTITIPYKITNDTDNGITANQVSVLMTNASWTDNGWSIGSGVEPQYSYAKLNDDGTLVLPSDYEGLNLYIIAEQVNGEKETDYASTPLRVTIPEPSHKWNAATCTKPKTCSICGETEPVQRDLPSADAEHHSPCMPPHLLQQPGQSRDEPEDAAVPDGVLRAGGTRLAPTESADETMRTLG